MGKFIECFCIALTLLFSQIVLAESSKAKVGVLMPFTGEVAAIAEKTRKGFVLAEEQYADKVKVVYEDIGSVGTGAAVRAATKLVEYDNVVALVGPYGPEQTTPIAPVAAKKGLHVFSFTLCSRDFEKLSNVFCAYPTIAVQLESMLPLLKQRKLKTLAVITEESGFGRESLEGLEVMAQHNGFSLPIKEVVQPSERDVRTTVAKIRKQNPQGVFVAFGNPSQAFVVLRQLWEGGYRGERFAFIDYDDKYLKEFGTFTEGVYIPGAFNGKFSEKFLKIYQDRYHEVPDLYAAEAYDLLTSVLRALELNNWSKVKLSEQVTALDYSTTAIPGFRFKLDRTVVFPMGVLVAKDGHFVPVP